MKIYPIDKYNLLKISPITKSGFYNKAFKFLCWQHLLYRKEGGEMLETKTNPRVHSLCSSIIHIRNISIKLRASREQSAFPIYSFSNITQRTNRLTFAFFPSIKNSGLICSEHI